MNKAEAHKIIEILIVAYPNFYNLQDELPKKRLIKISEIIKKFEYSKFDHNLNSWLKKNKYPPSISDIHSFGHEPKLKTFDVYEQAINKVNKIEDLEREKILKELRDKYAR